MSAFWDFQARFPDAYFSGSFGRNIFSRTKSSLTPNAKILDLGCGTGSFSELLLSKGYAVWSSDPSAKSRAAASDRLKPFKRAGGIFTVGQLLRNKEKFDVIFLIEVIEHLNDSDLDTVFKDVKNLLAPSGKVIITTPNNEILENSLQICPECSVIFHKWQHVRSWTPATLEEFVRARGLLVNRLVLTDFSVRPFSATYFVDKLRRLRRRNAEPHLLAELRHRS